MEILFKGKRVDNDEWVEGYYVRAEYENNTAHQIYVNATHVVTRIKISHPVEVHPESVTQIKPVPINHNKVMAELDRQLGDYFTLDRIKVKAFIKSALNGEIN